jgi:hypothetical protein
MSKELTQLERINHLENVVSKLLTNQRDLMSKFAYFWYDEKKRMLAIVTRIKGDEADLVAFSNSWSGGMMEVPNAKLLIRKENVPDDEIIKTGKWEPLLTFDEVLEEELAKLAPVVDDAKKTGFLKGKIAANAGTSG